MRLPVVLPWRSLAVAAAALVVAALPGLSDALKLNFEAVAGGELWRLWTSHLVHGSGEHLAWNIAGLLGLGVLFERALRGRLWVVLISCAPLVSLGTVVLQPQLSCYFGLSGLLNSIWIVGALLTAREERRRGHLALSWLFLGCVLADLAKIGWEGLSGAAIFTGGSHLGGVAVPLAHALGALGGMAYLLPDLARAPDACRVLR